MVCILVGQRLSMVHVALEEVGGNEVNVQLEDLIVQQKNVFLRFMT